MPKVAGFFAECMACCWFVLADCSTAIHMFPRFSKHHPKRIFVKMGHQVKTPAVCLFVYWIVGDEDQSGLDVRVGILWNRGGVTSSNPYGKECTEWDNVRMLDEQYVESEFQACRYVQIYVLLKKCAVSANQVFLATNRVATGICMICSQIPYKNWDLIIIYSNWIFF